MQDGHQIELRTSVTHLTDALAALEAAIAQHRESARRVEVRNVALLD
ncbi:hypothetical protein [Cellulomonas bogoriensis]|nr:hypothetical protein [Cellulomonas bogoriensis]